MMERTLSMIALAALPALDAPRALMIADSYQNAFRINCFAEGVGVLLSAILCGVGVLGLCLMNRSGARHAS